MNRTIFLLAAGPLVLSAVPAAAASVPEAVLQCRELRDVAARLGCYDAIAVPATAAASAAVAAATTTAAVARGVPAVAAATPPAPRSVAPVAAASAFGLPAVPAAEALSLNSRVQGRFEGWQRGTRLRLANGQVWEVVDGTVAVYDLDSPGVTVRRGLLGSYFIEIEGVSATPRVRRVP